MTRAKLFSGTFLLLAVLGIAVGDLLPRHADAQVVYQCPPGYAYDPVYGCVPLSYFYGPPAYVYPGFGFFYGGHWDHWHEGYPRGGAPHGGAPHGGAPHGGGGGHRR